MTNPGGISTLRGVTYEIKIVLYYLKLLLDADITCIRYQPLSSALQPKDQLRPIHADDISYKKSDDVQYYCQAKYNSTDSDWTINRLLKEGVIHQFYNQNQETPNGILIFASNLPSQRLKYLNEKANQSISSEEFLTILNQQGDTDVRAIIEQIHCDNIALWKMLKQVQCKHFTQEQLEEIFEDYFSKKYPDSDKCIGILKAFVECNPGYLITKDIIEKEFEKKGIFPSPPINSSEIEEAFRRASNMLGSYKSDIQGIHIEREETNVLFNWICTDTQDKAIGMLLEGAGTGKSVIMRDLLCMLENKNIPVLGIKADLLGNILDEEQLQNALNLPYN